MKSKIREGIRHPRKVWSYVLRQLEPIHLAPRLALTSRYQTGVSIFEEDWDLLIVLDTCRVDALRAVAQEYEFLPSAEQVQVRWSRGGQTAEWLCQNFTSRFTSEINRTLYVSGNAWTEAVFEQGARPEDDRDLQWVPTKWDVVDRSTFGELVQAWQHRTQKEYESDGVWGPHPRPQTVTDFAVSGARNQDFDRIVAHYKQPHTPYDSLAIAEDRHGLALPEQYPFKYLREGGDRRTVWELYLNELRNALDSIETLLDNVNAQRVIITSDHGEAFGEFLMYGHSPGSIQPNIRRVPWTVTDASDTETYEPPMEQYTFEDRSVEQQLEALGYR